MGDRTERRLKVAEFDENAALPLLAQQWQIPFLSNVCLAADKYFNCTPIVSITSFVPFATPSRAPSLASNSIVTQTVNK